MSHTPTPVIRGATDLPLARRAEVGGVVVHLLEAGLQRLDGGAMFGVVPKPLWERRIPADERNRIPLAMRCTLFETGGEVVLVETGLGNKESEKFTDIYGVENAGTALEDPDRLHSAIRAAGYSADDVTLVINTHLHFDHAGGNTFRGGDGEVRPAFPNARYLVQRGEWEYAHDTNERTAASYLPHNFDPVAEAGQLQLLEGDSEILPGLSVICTPGHCPFHQSVLLRTEQGPVCILADVVPTMAHLPLPWIMGYDVEPLRTLESKRSLLRRAVDEDWLLVSVHDPVVPAGRVREGRRGVEIDPERGPDWEPLAPSAS
jgi:glyoxylase-like metal-dependent hydrolase (beta-lactamase superfamily II)